MKRERKSQETSEIGPTGKNQGKNSGNGDYAVQSVEQDGERYCISKRRVRQRTSRLRESC